MPVPSLLLAATTVILTAASAHTAVPATHQSPAIAPHASFMLAAEPKADGIFAKILGSTWVMLKPGTDVPSGEIHEFTKTEMVVSDKDIGPMALPLEYGEETDTTLVIKAMGDSMILRFDGDKLQAMDSKGVVHNTYTRK